ncbi:TonB-dependent receptor [Algoriphagus kandeliae]|uniref:TonB-dependent receptor n=1 Tax=Algoriphagus kandeliae TaxID=2562278 RepID=A0A4Y9R1U8_9BACT|nr:TonB-dependent receptor [Algoriphagus kandeliae]TFV97543.1 TonB-dependent receptor [Algoriphagus kandeliae]
MKYLFSALIAVFLFFFSFGISFPQSQLTGIVLDRENSLPLPGASVFWENDISSGVVSGLDGSFSISILNLPAILKVSFVGYETSTREITAKDLDKPLKFFLSPEELSLEEVLIQELRPDENLRSLETGKNRVPIQTIKNIPALFGEVDLLRSLQLLPGVQTAGEGTTGLFVRGGSADQNLVQLDGAPVYNPSHFFGFFSVFNPDALSEVELYKGNMPASFGGRLSSLIDVSLREGNNSKIHGEGGIGTISSRLTLDGPLFSENSTFVISGRRTYADVFLGLSSDEDIRNNKLNFHDLSGKAVFRVGDRDRISVSSYQGRDFLGLDDQFGLGWSNWVSSAQWSRNIDAQTFFDLEAYHSRYYYSLEFEDPDNGFDWGSRLSESGVKGTWSQIRDKVQTYWGFHSQLYHFAPIELIPAPGASFDGISTNPKNGLLNNVFAGASFELNSKLSVEGGLRGGFYNQLGSGVKYLYEGEVPGPDVEILDSVRYDRLENIQFYQGLEPRLAFRYLINDRFSIKSAYNRNFQYVQIASNSSAGLPIDRWILADSYVRPIRSDQISLGFFRNFEENKWELSIEGYYKTLDGIIDLRNGAQVLFTDNVETEILSGKGWSYGTEFLLRKNMGKTTGWLVYTWSRAWRKIDGISQGQAYNPRFDRPHDVTLVLNHEFSPKWSAGLTFVYTTGQAVTFPIGTYESDNQQLPLFSPFRNQDRFPDYHRMDASITWKNDNKGKKWRGSWNFSIYNLYGRKNPFAYEFREIYNDDIAFNPGDGEPITSSRQGIIMTYLFTFLPSITYNFQF